MKMNKMTAMIQKDFVISHLKCQIHVNIQTDNHIVWPFSHIHMRDISLFQGLYVIVPGG